jgi:hypothetical protein
MSDWPAIPPVENPRVIPPGAVCQEASVLSFATYVPCGDPATAVVYHPKDRRHYYMCAHCARHNVRNRGGELVTGRMTGGHDARRNPAKRQR